MSLKVAIAIKRVGKVHNQKKNLHRLSDRQYINSKWMWYPSDNNGKSASKMDLNKYLKNKYVNNKLRMFPSHQYQAHTNKMLQAVKDGVPQFKEEQQKEVKEANHQMRQAPQPGEFQSAPSNFIVGSIRE